MNAMKGKQQILCSEIQQISRQNREKIKIIFFVKL